jgi:hypothetical protein
MEQQRKFLKGHSRRLFLQYTKKITLFYSALSIGLIKSGFRGSFKSLRIVVSHPSHIQWQNCRKKL